MTFRELLEKYRAGQASEEERALVEAELEKSEAIADYLAEQVEDELTTIVDLGGCVVNVMVNHRVYGKLNAPLNIKSRRDVQSFINDLKTAKSTPLLNVTSGYHFHRINAESEEVLDEIEEALKRKGYLAQLLPYETADAVGE